MGYGLRGSIRTPVSYRNPVTCPNRIRIVTRTVTRILEIRDLVDPISWVHQLSRPRRIKSLVAFCWSLISTLFAPVDAVDPKKVIVIGAGVSAIADGCDGPSFRRRHLKTLAN